MGSSIGVGFAGSVCVVLCERASDALPVRPEISLPLMHSALAGLIGSAAYQLGYAVT
ncbi:hypothetical protein ACSVIA_01300 [Rhodococcus erythropolis]|uniref:hypothetical protein n=1 Tax=Rhodococcus erythropolis TaxID=1833 RepID=UPI004040EDBE